MAIPDFQTIMLPLLKFCADGNEYTNQQALESLAEHFDLDDDDRKQLLPSGQQCVFDNRVAWARAHMKMAELVENTKRGVFRITERGKIILAQSPSEINLRFLKQFPEYIKARDRSHETKKEEKSNSACEEQESKTPSERLEEAYMTLRESLTNEILSQLKSSTPIFFEKVVVEVLVKMGYGGSRKDAGQAIGRSGDEGIDGIIKEDRLGLDIIYIQAKKWENTVSRPEIQKFAGALQGKRARKGIFITTSDFSKSAREYVSAIESKIILIDGQQFANFMIDFCVGVATDAVYELKRLDFDYFSENYQYFYSRGQIKGARMSKSKNSKICEKNELSLVRSSAAEYLTFVAAGGGSEASVEMRYEDENIWLTQKMMATLYDVSVPAINQHLKRVFTDNELTREATVKQYLIVQTEGSREVRREVEHYSLQARS